jgi:hypothetical protein
MGWVYANSNIELADEKSGHSYTASLPSLLNTSVRPPVPLRELGPNFETGADISSICCKASSRVVRWRDAAGDREAFEALRFTDPASGP